jgi:hypothetical protein
MSFFDSIFKGILGIWFGNKLINKIARKRALQSPEVKQKVEALRDAIAEFDAIMEEYNKKK